MPTPPSWARYLLALAAGLSFLGIYVGAMYPFGAYVCFGVVGAINASCAYLGWGGPYAPTPVSPTVP